MINKIWNWIKNIFVLEKQDPHLTLYEEVKLTHCKGHRRYRNNCEDCRKIVA